MAEQQKIEFILSALDQGMTTVFTRTEAALRAFHKEASAGGGILSSLQERVVALVGSFAGMEGLLKITEIMEEAGQAAFNMETSLKAASREFKGVGDVEHWEAAIGRLSDELVVYADDALKNAVSTTVDMTKNLGLSAEQMERVVRISGDLAAGKRDLGETVEKVSKALMGEAKGVSTLGLTLKNEYVQSWYEANNAHGKAWDSLSKLEQVQVRFQVLLEQSVGKQGAAAESANTYAGALKLVHRAIEETIEKNVNVIKAMDGLGAALKDNANRIADFISSLVSVVAKTAAWAAENVDLLRVLAEIAAPIVLTVASLKLFFSTAGDGLKVIRGLGSALKILAGTEIVEFVGAIKTLFVEMASGMGVAFLTQPWFILAAAITVTVAAVWAAVEAFGSLKKIRAEEARLNKETARINKETDEVYQAIGKQLGLVINSEADYQRLKKEGIIVQDAVTGKWVNASSLIPQAMDAIVAGADSLIQKFDEIKKAGKNSTDALKATFADLELDNIFSAQVFEQTFNQLVENHKASVEEIKNAMKGMFSKMPIEELEQFQQKVEVLFTRLEVGSKAAATVMQATMEAALEKLGVDVNKATTGVSTAAKAARDAFVVVAESGTESAKLLDASWSAALAKMSDPKEIESLSAALQALAESGKVSSEQLSDYLGQASDRLAVLAKAAAKAAAEASGLTKAQDEAAQVLKSTDPSRDKAIQQTNDYSAALAQAKDETAAYNTEAKASGEVDRARIDMAEQHASALRVQAEAVSATAQAEQQRYQVALAAFRQNQESLQLAREQLRVLLMSGSATAAEITAAKDRVRALGDQEAAARSNVQAAEATAKAAVQAARAFGDEAEAAGRAADAISGVVDASLAASRVSTGSMVNRGAQAFVELEQTSTAAANSVRDLFAYLGQDQQVDLPVDLGNLSSVNAKLAELDQRLVESQAWLRDVWDQAGGWQADLARQMNLMYTDLYNQEGAALSAMRTLLTEAQGVDTLRQQLAALTGGTTNAYQAALEVAGRFDAQASGAAGAVIGLINQSEAAISAVQYLDQTQLDGLRQGIESAKDYLVQLTSQALAAVDALAGVNRALLDQIDQERNNQAAIEARRYEDQLKQIEDLHAKADGLAEDEYTKALLLAEELHNIKLGQIAERAAADKQAADEEAKRQLDILASARATAEAQKKKDLGLAVGGHLPGYGGGDRIRALLEAGEFVLRKEAVRYYGAARIAAMNAMRLPRDSWMPQIHARLGGLVDNLRLPELPRFASGGSVPAAGTTRLVEIRLRHEQAGVASTVFSEEGQVERLLSILETAGMRA